MRTCYILVIAITVLICIESNWYFLQSACVTDLERLQPHMYKKGNIPNGLQQGRLSLYTVHVSRHNK
jgi:hypothetical protein